MKNNEQRFKKFFQKGQDYLEKKEYHKAIECFTEAIKLKDSLPKEILAAYKNRGLVKYYLKDYEGAIADFDKAIELEPKDVNAYNNRGLAKAGLKEYKGAIADFDKAIELEPKDVNAYNNRGLAKAGLKEYKGAIADYDQAIELEPKDARFYNNRGNAKAGLKEYKGAIADYDQAIELEPKDARFYSNRGNAKAGLKEYKGAIADYDQAIKLDSKDVNAYYNRGLTKYELKDYEGAIADFEQAIKLAPDNLAFKESLRIVKDALDNKEVIDKIKSDSKKAIEDSKKAIEEIEGIFDGKYFEEREGELKEEYKNNNCWIKGIFISMLVIGGLYIGYIICNKSNSLEWLEILRNISMMFFLTSPLVYFSRVLIHNKNRLEVLIEDCFNKKVLFLNTYIAEDKDLQKELLKQTYSALLEQSTTELMVRLINKKKSKEDEKISKIFKEIESLKKIIEEKNVK